MGPPVAYKLTSACQDACTPQWLMQLLYEEHGVLHGPCPSCPGTDGLQADWSPDRMNFVNPPFSSAKQWLQKAADETLNSVVSIVLVPFRLHTRYMWHTLQYAASFCIISSNEVAGTAQQLQEKLQVDKSKTASENKKQVGKTKDKMLHIVHEEPATCSPAMSVR